MERFSNLTVYKGTTVPLNKEIADCLEKFNNLFTLKAHLKERAQIISNLLKSDTKWLEICSNQSEALKSQLSQAFYKLASWIEEFHHSDNRDNIIGEVDEYIRNCYVSIIQAFLYDEDNSEITQRISEQAYRNYKSKDFSFIIKYSVETFIMQYWDTLNNRILYDSLKEILSTLLKNFTKNGINKIYIKEIEKHLAITNPEISKEKLKEIISYIYASYDCFRRFINRNFLYGQIEKSLREASVFYEGLEEMQDENCSNCKYMIRISAAPIPSYENREFLVERAGITNSDRYVDDYLITIGRESEEEFVNDITLPGCNETDSIFGLIFITKNGLNLIDISSQADILVKIPANGVVEIEDGMILIFGKSHQVVVDFASENGISGAQQSLKISSFGGCQTTKTILNMEINQFSGFNTGKNNYQLNLPYDDIAQNHAQIYFDDEKQKFVIRDIENEYGTFYKLKKKREIEANTQFKAMNLKNGQMFSVYDFIFHIEKIN